MTQIGLWRDTANILQDTGAQDASGQEIKNFEGNPFIEEVNGELKQVSGGEVVRGQQMQTQTSHLFTCWWVDGVTSDMKLKTLEDEKIYGIVDVAKVQSGINHEMRIQLKAN